MRLKIIQSLAQPLVVEAQQLLACDANDKPFLLILERGPGQYFVKTAADPEFPRLIAALGIDRTVFARSIPVHDLRSFLPAT